MVPIYLIQVYIASAHAVVFRAAVLFLVYFQVIKYIHNFCHSHLKYRGLAKVASLKYRSRFWKTSIWKYLNKSNSPCPFKFFLNFYELKTSDCRRALQ